MQRGNVVVSRKHIISSFKTADKKKLIEGFKVGDTVKGTCKQLTSFGAFFKLESGIDVLCHTSEISYSRVNHPDELLSLNDVKELKIIGVDLEKLQLSTSIKALQPNPFDDIDKYSTGKIYKVKILKITDFGFFAELQEGLVCLCHSSELSHTRKNVSAKKLFKIGQEVSVFLKEIDKEQKRIAISYKMTQENPYEVFIKKYKIGDTVNAKIISKNEYSLFVQVADVKELEIFIHANNLVWTGNGEEELAKYKINDDVKIKILEINTEDQKN
jgi:small subunit ribosomal protein S1